MMPDLPAPFSLEAGQAERQDYLLDMIAQLSQLARDIGEIEVAIHLDATVEARRYTVDKRDVR